MDREKVSGSMYVENFYIKEGQSESLAENEKRGDRARDLWNLEKSLQGGKSRREV